MIIIDTKINIENLNLLLEQNMPYIVKTISSVTGKYVSVEHDDEFMVALNAFAEAVEKYDSSKGNFLSFVGVVIKSRLVTFLKKENKRENEISLEYLVENGYEPRYDNMPETNLKDEIDIYKAELLKFGITLENMVEYSPKHRNTRETSVLVAEQSSRDEKIVFDTYRKKKLPVRAVAKLCNVTEKIVKTSKNFILGTMLIFVLKLSGMIFWIKKSR